MDGIGKDWSDRRVHSRKSLKYTDDEYESYDERNFWHEIRGTVFALGSILVASAVAVLIWYFTRR